MTADSVAQGEAALRKGRWADARAAFTAALAREESAEALAGMGEVLWWLDRPRESIGYHERAYGAFCRVGDTARAAMTAISLSITQIANLGNHPASLGWFARAERVAGERPDPAVARWLVLMRGFLEPDRDRACDLLREAAQLGRAAGDADVELVALADLGERLVVAGQLREGLALIDEAMAGACARECSRLDTVVFTSCNMLVACDRAGDLDRATHWLRLADEFIRTYGCPFLHARCRTLYGSLLVRTGHWDQAERELGTAVRASVDALPALHAMARARLADLRLRQGRLEEAEALLPAGECDLITVLPAATVRLARGEPVVAVALLRRCLEVHGDTDVAAPPVLALLVDAHLATGDLAAAREMVARLDTQARDPNRPATTALAAVATAHLCRATGEPDRAIGQLERALHLLSALPMPLESARVRLELAQALAGTQPQVAVAEARGALTELARLGATTDADAAAQLLRTLGVAARTPGPRHPASQAPGTAALTSREREVLALVGCGLSNPEIAQRLFISRKTAAHHVSNVLVKLGLRNRAEAVAYLHSERDRDHDGDGRR